MPHSERAWVVPKGVWGEGSGEAASPAWRKEACCQGDGWLCRGAKHVWGCLAGVTRRGRVEEESSPRSFSASPFPWG